MEHSANHSLFYSNQITDTHIVLDDCETHHAKTVLRLTEGSRLEITNGYGEVFSGIVLTLEKRQSIIQIVKKETFSKVVPEILCYIGIPSKDSFECAVENLVPLGTSAIIPVQCHYCQQPWWKSGWQKFLSRLERKMISAAKQSLNPWLPEILSPCSFQEAIQNSANAVVVVAEPRGQTMSHLKSNISAMKPFHCFIGPPGGFFEQELNEFEKINAHMVSLSQFRLRTELSALMLVGALRMEKIV